MKLTGDGNGFAYKVIFKISKLATCGKYTEWIMAEVGALYLMLLFVFIAPTAVTMNKYVVSTQVDFDTAVVVELDTINIYMMLECSHRGGEFSDRAIDTFFEKHFLQFSCFTSPFIISKNSSLIVISAVTVICIGVFRI